MPVEVKTVAYACRYCLDRLEPWHWSGKEREVFRHIRRKKVAEHESTHRSVLMGEYRTKRLAQEARRALAKEFGVEWKSRWRRVFFLMLRLSNLYPKGGPFFYTVGLNYDMRDFLVQSTPSGRPVITEKRYGKSALLPGTPIRKYVVAALEQANKPGLGQVPRAEDQQLRDLWEVVNGLIQETRGLHHEIARYLDGSRKPLGKAFETTLWALTKAVEKWEKEHQQSLGLPTAEPIDPPVEKGRVA
jgi:hypothetical protein